MDSANIHHLHHHQHQLQDQHVVVVASSSPLVLPSCYAAGSNSSNSTTHGWTPNNNNTILNTSNSFNACSNGETVSSRDHSWQQNNLLISSSLDGSITQDHLNFNWENSNNHNNISSHQPSYDLHLSRLKNETTSENSSLSQSYMKIINNERRDLKDLRNYNSSFNGGFHQLSSDDSNNSSSLSSSSGSVITTMPPNIIRGSFNQFFPNLNDLNGFNHMSLANSSSNLDMNLQALDLFNSSKLNDHEGFGQLSRDHHNHQHGFFKDGFSYGIDHHMQQQPSLRPLNIIPNNISSTFSNGVAEAKRSSSSIMLAEPKAPQPPPKKSRIEPRSACPPFNVMKVRKEKLGDRIAALQQLVAPFGKTDTASVLMEAIGYIKFLQNQVETLSVPYMKSSRNKARVMHGSTTGNENEESMRDLRSRGLCLVPVSCLSYVADGGGGVWPPPPPNFGGGV